MLTLALQVYLALDHRREDQVDHSHELAPNEPSVALLRQTRAPGRVWSHQLNMYETTDEIDDQDDSDVHSVGCSTCNEYAK